MHTISIDCCKKLLSDLYNIVLWSNNLDLQLNISKCVTIIFSRCLTSINLNYGIQDSNLPKAINEICDLGLILCTSLNLNILSIFSQKPCCKALEILDSLKHISSKFKFCSSFKTLYYALVEPVIEYESVFWDSHTMVAYK